MRIITYYYYDVQAVCLILAGWPGRTEESDALSNAMTLSFTKLHCIETIIIVTEFQRACSGDAHFDKRFTDRWVAFGPEFYDDRFLS